MKSFPKKNKIKVSNFLFFYF